MTSREKSNLESTENRIRRELLQQATAALKSAVCLCSGPKAVGKAVCRQCWDTLHIRYHRGLYRGIGAGFEYAYESARAWLRTVRGIGA